MISRRRRTDDEVTLAAKAAARALNQWPLVFVLGVVAIGFLITLLWNWSPGLLVMGAAFGLAAVLRLVLPERAAGLLRVRSRWFDVTFLTACAASVIVLVLSRLG